MNRLLISTSKIIYACMLLTLSISCQDSDNKLKISFSRACKTNLNPVRAENLHIKNKDSTIFSTRIPVYYSLKDTLILDSLPNGVYKITCRNVFGKTLLKQVELKGGKDVVINFKLDSINTDSLLKKTPVSNLKEGESYSIDWIEGGVASFKGSYLVRNLNGHIYLRTTNYNIGILTKPEIEKVMRFEAELLEMSGVAVKSSLNGTTYSIKKNGQIVEIIDNSHNWQGWTCTIGEILKNRFK